MSRRRRRVRASDAIEQRLRDIGQQAAGRVRWAGSAAARLAPVPLAARGAVAAGALLSLLVAVPSGVVGARYVVGLVALALLPAIWPRGFWPTVVILASVFVWIVATTAYGEPVGFGRPVLLASALYVTHSMAALSAALPLDARVAPAVLNRWLTRLGAVLALTVASAVFVLALPSFAGNRSYLVAALAGLAFTVALTTTLARSIRR